MPIHRPLQARVVEELPEEVGWFQFSHALVKETLAAELNLNRRVRLHARIGLALEDLYQNRVEEHAAELVHHFHAAETVTGVDKVVQYALLAGHRALAALAYEDALTFFQMGLQSKEIGLSGEEPAQDADAAALLFGLGRAQAATYGRLQMPEAFRTLSRAFDFYIATGAVEEAVELSLLHIPAMSAGFVSKNIPRALELVPHQSLSAGRLLFRHGLLLSNVDGDYPRSKDSFAKALAIARQQRDIDLETSTLYYSGRVELYHCNWQQSLAQSLEANQLSMGSKHEVLPQNKITASGALCVMGELAEAQQYATSSIASAREIRELGSLVTGNWIAEWISLLKGNWATAREHSEHALDLSPADPRNLASRVLLEYQLGEFDGGNPFLERFLAAMALAETMLPMPPYYVAVPMATPMLCLALTFDVDSPHTNEVERIVREYLSVSKIPWVHLLARTSLGLLASMRDDGTEAQVQYGHLGSVKGTFSPVALSGDRLLGLLASWPPLWETWTARLITSRTPLIFLARREPVPS